MPADIDPQRLRAGYQHVRDALLAERTPAGHWVGELSTSALSTATAVMALVQVLRAEQDVRGAGHCRDSLKAMIAAGLDWLVAHQSDDGGWGDTVKSLSNISTTMLCHAVLVAANARPRGSGASSTDSPPAFATAVDRAQGYIDRSGGVPALIARYGKDKTFSVPILTHCALAGLVDWRDIPALPFELACIPARFYKTVRLPVVSYALPALIAIGQVRHHFAPTRNPLARLVRNLAVGRSLRVLERIQPANGGFLEATPLTSFVTMSLAAKGLAGHPVVRKGIDFIVNSVRPDGSWPIDTNLATWVTTLAVNALGDDLPDDSRLPILNWLLEQQYKTVHPYTNADPGGWAWTDLPGGVPDADDTAGAILALLELTRPLAPRQSRDRQGAASSASAIIEASKHPERPTASSSITIEDPGGDALPETLPYGRGSERKGAVSSASAIDGVNEQAELRASAARVEEDSRVGALRETLPYGRGSDADAAETRRVHDALTAGVHWLRGLQNRDGGFPTFCRGWGALPFDRSSPDITAHGVRGLIDLYRSHVPSSHVAPSILLGELGAWGGNWITPATMPHGFGFRLPKVIGRAFRYLRRVQRPDGSWLPLWFGNQHATDDINPTYGTAKVLAAYWDLGLPGDAPAQRGLAWLRNNQNPDGGWGAGPGTPSSVEETALAVEALLRDTHSREPVARGLEWLLDRIDADAIAEPAPIGFYFAKLWYFERLYPLIFAVSCLRRAVAKFSLEPAATAVDGGS